jgi:hypothetical protein
MTDARSSRDEAISKFIDDWFARNVVRLDYPPPRSEVMPLVDRLTVDGLKHGYDPVDLVRVTGDLIGAVICEMSPIDG